MSPDEFYSRAMRAADQSGRLPLSRMTGWEIFPFEPDGLTVVPLAPPELPEPPRKGEDREDCPVCTSDRPMVWSDEQWQLWPMSEETGAPLVLLLEPRAHYDLSDLPDERAAELGILQAHIARAVEALPHIARAHVSRWGDGGAHLHVFFIARPAGFPQLRGTCMAIWNDLLPAVPADLISADAATVGAAVARSYGGQAR